MELCLLIPAKNEESVIEETINTFHTRLHNQVQFNILVINDHSNDRTEEILQNLASKYPNMDYVNNQKQGGVGNAIKYGLEKWKGDVISICMADGSDDIADILKSFKLVKEDHSDCVFGSRFIKGGEVTNYPQIKLLLNRIFNNYVKIRSSNNYNDFTNIFKTYSRNALEIIGPISSDGFSIGLEMSLKSFKKGLKIAVIPISWKQRSAGKSKLRLRKNFKLYMQTFKENR